MIRCSLHLASSIYIVTPRTYLSEDPNARQRVCVHRLSGRLIGSGCSCDRELLGGGCGRSVGHLARSRLCSPKPLPGSRARRPRLSHRAPGAASRCRAQRRSALPARNPTLTRHTLLGCGCLRLLPLLPALPLPAASSGGLCYALAGGRVARMRFLGLSSKTCCSASRTGRRTSSLDLSHLTRRQVGNHQLGVGELRLSSSFELRQDEREASCGYCAAAQSPADSGLLPTAAP